MLETFPLADRRQTGVKLPEDMLLKLGYIALKRKTTMSALIEEAVTQWYGKQEEKEEFGEIARPTPESKPGRPPKGAKKP